MDLQNLQIIKNLTYTFINLSNPPIHRYSYKLTELTLYFYIKLKRKRLNLHSDYFPRLKNDLYLQITENPIRKYECCILLRIKYVFLK